MKRCKTCKYWKLAKEFETGHNLSLGRCEATPMLFDSTEWDREGERRTFLAEHATKSAFVQDGSDFKATLYTKPEHGCVMHEDA